MNKELAIHHLLKMYNRKVDDNTVSNYLEVCRSHSNEDVTSAVKMLISMSETLPYPRTLADILTRQFSASRKTDTCERCDGKGYTVDDDKFDSNGLENFSYGTVARCYCFGGNHAEMPDIKPVPEIRTETYARIFAGEVAKRAVDGEVIQSPSQWGRYMWNQESFDVFCVLVEDMSMAELVGVTAALKECEPGDCQTVPLEVAKEVRSRVKSIPTKGLFSAV
jgi:hypothetical protein